MVASARGTKLQIKGCDYFNLISNCYATVGILCPVLITQLRRETEKLGKVPQRATKMMRCLEDLTYEERWKKFGLFSLEKRCLKAYLITVFQHFIVSYRED